MPEVEVELEEESIIVRRKKFALVPMNEAEAIEQMKLLGHDNFFIFFDADANRMKVLYRRWNGTYGLMSRRSVEERLMADMSTGLAILPGQFYWSIMDE